MTRLFGRMISVLLIAVFLFVSAVKRDTGEKDADSNKTQSPFTDAARTVSESVVAVTCHRADDRVSAGSGVVIFDKYILTNYRVIEGAEKLFISALGKEGRISATVCAYDEKTDAAVLYAKKLDIKPVLLGDSDRLQMGEWAICVGNPISDAFRGTITVGIVSAMDREIASGESTDQYGLKTETVNPMIQTDAALNSGVSGGGLFNVLGQLIGIPTKKYTGSEENNLSVEGIGLAIPINSVKPLIQMVIGERLTDENIDVNEDA